MQFAIQRFETVDSTNRLASTGNPGDVFVARNQTAGRGRLDHRWHSRSGENLLMSVVLDVTGVSPSEVATLPLLAGFAVITAIRELAGGSGPAVGLKWPNDVYVDGRKICGILCSRHGDRIVVGIGLNVRQLDFPELPADRATSLALAGVDVSVEAAMQAVLASLAEVCGEWRRGGFAALYARIEAADCLKGREVSVMKTDEDTGPVRGICRGISPDGSLLVGDEKVYAGEVRLFDRNLKGEKR